MVTYNAVKLDSGSMLFAFFFIFIMLACSASTDASPLTGRVTGFASYCHNDMPIFNSGGVFNVTESIVFYHDMNVTDFIKGFHRPAAWYDNSTFFNIDRNTGEILFLIPNTVDNDMVGWYPVEIIYDDGVECPNSIVSQVVYFNITWVNHPPEIITFYPETNFTFTEEQPQHFNITFRDLDNENTPTYDDDNLTVEWYIDGILLKNDSLLSPRNYSVLDFIPDYNSSGIRVLYVYVRDKVSYDVHSWILNITDVFVDVDIIQPENGTSLLLFDRYEIKANISAFENRSVEDCNVTLSIINTTVFDITENESYNRFIDHIGPFQGEMLTWEVYTSWIGMTDLNVTAVCREGGWTYDSTYTITVNVTENIRDFAFDEGYFYNEPDIHLPFGNYQYQFAINMLNTTTRSKRIVGCIINQSNCYDPMLPGCRQIFVNDTTEYGIAFYNLSLVHKITDDDIINSTLGGRTDNWIPWQIDRCGIYYEENMTPIHEEFMYRRIHARPLAWTTGDVANALNAKTAANMFHMNTIRADNLGDIAFSVKKYGGTKVELICNDGIDNPDDSDNLADCDDPDCWGITYSCLPKQSFKDPSLYYSPSGSHGTLAHEIPLGDMGQVYSSDMTFNTQIDYSMHQMPNGTLHIRLRNWGLSKTATFFIDGLPKIASVNKKSPGNTSAQGMMTYFLDKDGHPYAGNSIDGNSGYSNRIALRSYLSGGTEIRNLDTVLSITFAEPHLIDMSEGYILELTINYVKGQTPYEEKLNFTVYFDDPTYGPMPRWQSDNLKENERYIEGAGWYPCNDTVNNDFDFLNCEGNEEFCFELSSYDCYDIDCDGYYGPPAWNDYLGEFTTGVCTYHSEAQTNATCFDGYNNNWANEALVWGHANTNLALIDCRDPDCHLIHNGTYQCEYNIELTCDDGFDNDMYNLWDCELRPGGHYNDAEYDCAEFCRETTGNNTETGAQCDDGIDNDWDKWIRIDWSPFAGPNDYVLNTAYGAGMDCAWIEDHPDEDCNMTILGSGFRCELGRELTCDDGFDNDYDKGWGQPSPGWTKEAYESYFGLPYSESADFDDYDCQYDPRVPSSESLYPEWCFDGIDNDLDAYYWDGAWFVNTTGGGIDCNDRDCWGVTNPNNASQTCLPYEYNESDPFFDGLPEPDFFCKNDFDDDADGPKDCHDPDCKGKFDMCGACPATENVTWDGCADGFDNDYDGYIDCKDSDCIGYLGSYGHQFCTAPGKESGDYYCSDGFDNDGDGLIDCADPDCATASVCQGDLCNDDKDSYHSGNIDCADPKCYHRTHCLLENRMAYSYTSYTPPEKASAIFGGVTVTWDTRVRLGEDYTIRMQKNDSYNTANIYIGRLSGSGLPIGMGLDSSSYTISGPSAHLFETSVYNEDGTGTKGQIELIDQVPGDPTEGFDVTISIPTTETMPSIAFEYYHSIDGMPSLGNIIDAQILENIKPTIVKMISEPTDKGSIPYNGKVWIGIEARDIDGGSHNEGYIQSCFYEVSGPSGYSRQGQDSSDCRFEFNDIKESGIYTTTVWARDANGNYANPLTQVFDISVAPQYIEESSEINYRWFNATDPDIEFKADFLDDDASGIAACRLFRLDSLGNGMSLGSFPANSSGDMLTCQAELIAPTADQMYALWFEVEDSDGNTAESAKTTFFVCNNPESEGIGLHGEIWSCIYADMDRNEVLDYCEQKDIDITIRKHAMPDPIPLYTDSLNYTITAINRGFNTARNVTVYEYYPGLAEFLSANPEPDIENNTWLLGDLGEFDNRTITIETKIPDNLRNGTVITNMVMLTYIDSSDEMQNITIETNTTVIGNTPPVYINDLPSPHSVFVRDTIVLPFNLNDYVFDPDIAAGDIIRYEPIFEVGKDRAEIMIDDSGQVIVTGVKLGAVIVRFKAIDREGEYAISNKILIVVKARGSRVNCVPEWSCTEWSKCGRDGARYRTCTVTNNCFTEIGRPREIELCYDYEPESCFDGKMNHGEIGIDCGGPCSLDCCENNYLDRHLGEEGVDCGGPCKACAGLEVPGTFRIEMLGVFTSIILLIIALLTPKILYRGYRRITDYNIYIRAIRQREKLKPMADWLRKTYFRRIDKENDIAKVRIKASKIAEVKDRKEKRMKK